MPQLNLMYELGRWIERSRITEQRVDSTEKRVDSLVEEVHEIKSDIHDIRDKLIRWARLAGLFALGIGLIVKDRETAETIIGLIKLWRG